MAGSYSNPNPNQVTPQSPKRSKLFWLIPIGCLGILVVCGGGLAYFVYWAFNMGVNNEAVVQAKADVMASAEAQELFGTMEIGMPSELNNSQNGDQAIFDYKFPVSGSKQNGTMHLKAQMDGSTMKWSRTSLYVEATDGTRLDF